MSEKLVEEIIAYHKSRYTDTDHNRGSAKSANGGACDPGQQVTFSREGHSVDPKHHKIVLALKEHLEALGWRVEERPSQAKPDLLTGKGGNIALYEVKPDNENASIFMSVGQLLGYSVAMGDKVDKILVRPAAALKESLSVLLEKYSIKSLEYTERQSKFEFHNL